jgi:hypothetical protein
LPAGSASPDEERVCMVGIPPPPVHMPFLLRAGAPSYHSLRLVIELLRKAL